MFLFIFLQNLDSEAVDDFDMNDVDMYSASDGSASDSEDDNQPSTSTARPTVPKKANSTSKKKTTTSPNDDDWSKVIPPSDVPIYDGPSGPTVNLPYGAQELEYLPCEIGDNAW